MQILPAEHRHILRECGFGEKVYKAIFSECRLAIERGRAAQYPEELEDVVNIGVVRYPDEEHRNFQVST